MLRSMLKASDEAKLPTYLETETESNVALYERFGFTTCMQMKLPIIDQPMWTMIRESGHLEDPLPFSVLRSAAKGKAA